MRRMLGVILAVLFCPAIFAVEMIVTESSVDLNNDKKDETVRLVLKEGKKYNDENTWCGQGWKHEGKFTIVVRFPDGKQVETVLNPLWSPEYPTDDMFFRLISKDRPWKIEFADYNKDGVIDFNLGQYSGCNGFDYKLFSFEPDGRVYAIPLKSNFGDDKIYLDLWAIDAGKSENSTTGLKLMEKGFSGSHYDNMLGAGRTVFYEWDDKQHLFYAAKLEEWDGKLGKYVTKILDRQTNEYVIANPEPKNGAQKSEKIDARGQEASKGEGETKK